MEFRPLYQSSYFLAATCGSDLYGVRQGTAVLYVTHIFFFSFGPAGKYFW